MTSYEKELHNTFLAVLKSGLTKEAGELLLPVEGNSRLGMNGCQLIQEIGL